MPFSLRVERHDKRLNQTQGRGSRDRRQRLVDGCPAGIPIVAPDVENKRLGKGQVLATGGDGRQGLVDAASGAGTVQLDQIRLQIQAAKAFEPGKDAPHCVGGKGFCPVKDALAGDVPVDDVPSRLPGLCIADEVAAPGWAVGRFWPADGRITPAGDDEEALPVRGVTIVGTIQHPEVHRVIERF